MGSVRTKECKPEPFNPTYKTDSDRRHDHLYVAWSRHLTTVVKVQIAFGRHQRDALVVRHACIALQRVAQMQTRPSPDRLQAAAAGLMLVLVGSPLEEDGWYSAAEAALKGIYALHPAPEAVATAVLRRLATAAFGTGDLPQQIPQKERAVILHQAYGHGSPNSQLLYLAARRRGRAICKSPWCSSLLQAMATAAAPLPPRCPASSLCWVRRRCSSWCTSSRFPAQSAGNAWQLRSVQRRRKSSASPQENQVFYYCTGHRAHAAQVSVSSRMKS